MKGKLEGGKMVKKREYMFILFVLLVLYMGGVACGQIIKPESVGDFISNFGRVVWMLIVVPVLVIGWRDIDVRGGKISKRGVHFLWALVVLTASLTVWNVCWLEREKTTIDKVWSVVASLWLLGFSLIYIIKYIKAGKAGTEELRTQDTRPETPETGGCR